MKNKSRLFTRNPLDEQIFRDQVKRDLVNKIGLSTLSLEEATALTIEALKQIANEAQQYPTFDEYFYSV